jgi:hypothetical protein
MAAEKFSNAQYASNQTVLAVFTRRNFSDKRLGKVE